jgi:hypothetical protein
LGGEPPVGPAAKPLKARVAVAAAVGARHEVEPPVPVDVRQLRTEVRPASPRRDSPGTVERSNARVALHVSDIECWRLIHLTSLCANSEFTVAIDGKLGGGQVAMNDWQWVQW